MRMSVKTEELIDLKDIVLLCKDCGQEFVYTAEEQKFFASKGITGKPSRCLNCRKKRKEANDARSMNAMLQNPERFEVKCRVCGRVYLTSYKDVLPDVAKVCMRCVPEDFDLVPFFGSSNLAVNKALGYPKFKG